MKIVPLPAFNDNYIWLLRNDTHAAVVDPGNAKPVLAYLAEHKLQLAAILITHHHADHCGGVGELLAAHAAPVFGPAKENIATIDRPVGKGDTVNLGELGVALRVIDLPGHTAGHVGYYGAGALFCGDTLFAAGCGRLFEGTPAQMYASLEKLAALPDDTQVYCAHEYTLANLKFAAAVEPANPAIAERIAVCTGMRERGQPTVPFALAGERLSNPFLRSGESSVAAQAAVQSGRPMNDPIEVFAAIREWKNRF